MSEQEFDEAGMPIHLPMGVTADGSGPTEPHAPHHRVCWCMDDNCCWTQALTRERAEGAARAYRFIVDVSGSHAIAARARGDAEEERRWLDLSIIADRAADRARRPAPGTTTPHNEAAAAAGEERK